MSAPGGVYLRGVEMPLPAGERVLWQGAPVRGSLARHAFHVRKLAVYFAGLAGIATLVALRQPAPWRALATSAVSLGVSAVAACAFALLLALLTARTSVYAITDRRVVLRMGIALPVVLNVPLRTIESVAFARRPGGDGDIALRLADDVRVAYVVLWPHARAWRLRHPEPLLRSVADVERVGAILREALLAQIAAEAPAKEALPASRAATEVAA
jgi:hypothetical protein